jgi:hypothetical protein
MKKEPVLARTRERDVEPDLLACCAACGVHVQIGEVALAQRYEMPQCAEVRL